MLQGCRVYVGKNFSCSVGRLSCVLNILHFKDVYIGLTNGPLQMVSHHQWLSISMASSVSTL